MLFSFLAMRKRGEASKRPLAVPFGEGVCGNAAVFKGKKPDYPQNETAASEIPTLNIHLFKLLFKSCEFLQFFLEKIS